MASSRSRMAVAGSDLKKIMIIDKCLVGFQGAAVEIQKSQYSVSSLRRM